MKTTVVRVALALATAAIAGCGGDPCTEGQTVECACSFGEVGVRNCFSDGTFGACVCDGELPDASQPVIDAATIDAAPVDAAPIDAAPVLSCDEQLFCARPSDTRAALCGQLFDTETGDPIRAAAPTGALCDPGAPTATGPCALEVGFYDALGLAAAPGVAVPLEAGEIALDDCGRFRALELVRPFSGLITVGIDDNGASSADEVVLTGVALLTYAGENLQGLAAYSTRHSTDAAWTSSAGDPFSGESFAEHGVIVPIYLHGATPVDGVVVLRSGSTVPADDFYFADSDGSGLRRNIDPVATDTGPNGTGLMVDSALGTHSGLGAEPPGCAWPAVLLAAAPTLVWVHEMRAEVTGNPDLVCP